MTTRQAVSNQTLYVNSLIKWIEKAGAVIFERVLILDSANNICFTIPIDTKTGFPIRRDFEQLQQAERVPRELDPYKHLQGLKDEDLTEFDKGIRDESWKAIRQLVDDQNILDRRYRGRLVQNASSESKLPINKIYKCLRRFWQRGQIPNALLPDYGNCGAWTAERKTVNKRGRSRKTDEPDQARWGINIGEREEELLIKGLNTFYLIKKDKPVPLDRAYDLTMMKYFVPPSEVKGELDIEELLNRPAIKKFLPSVVQFRYVLEKNFTRSEQLRRRFGNRHFLLKNRPITGSAKIMAFGPGYLYQIDWTTADLNLVHSIVRNWVIGRPIVYLVVDTFSRMVVGVLVTLENPSYIVACLALENAISPKQEFYESLGIKGKGDLWPACGVPKAILADRGELISKFSDQIPLGLKTSMENAPPYRADAKGIVEQNFRLQNNQRINWLPGAVPGIKTRGDADSRKKAILTIEEFTHILVFGIIQYNWSRIENFKSGIYVEGKEIVRPVNLWQWGIHNKTGGLGEFSKDEIRRMLLPSGEAGISRKGFTFGDLHYESESSKVQELFSNASVEGSQKVRVAYHPLHVGTLYLRPGKNLPMERCWLTAADKDYERLTWAEYKMMKRERKIDEEESNDLLVMGAIEARVNHIVENAKQLTAQAVEKNGKIDVKEIKKNRDDEKLSQRQTQEQKKSGEPHSSTPEITKAPPANQSTAEKARLEDKLRNLFGTNT